MPLYEIYRRDGTPVQVEGPEGATTRQLINLYQEQQERSDEESVQARSCKDEAFRREYEDIQKRKPVTFGQQLQEIPKGILAGGATLAEQGLLGLASILGEEPELAVREKIQSVGTLCRAILHLMLMCKLG